ncbi:hypothetical protein [Aquimarina algiphila]|uniref:hypothetical protein n=1 Tax=Aquimarina algiphila TaxID=2047982 RepID=UPI00232E4595|nr:hypothetical protein [Aquimarina algiphila]
METLEIKKEAALKAHENASSKGRELLENLLGKKTFLKQVTERITTIDDILEDNGVTQKELDTMFANVPEHLKYQYIAELLCKSLNEGWLPDWDNGEYDKYYPWFKMGSSVFQCDSYSDWYSRSSVGSRLCFKSSELAKYAGEQFADVYRKFMIIE